ncbi:hypothetical protein PVAG01_00662 [Phlyctema vagabunda]|uniref:Zn(2)-C6 fungal-type domain-containing protein n=1 Tax=Phlyctema vagabunda TaxID=108571 RepID=A0ABR4PUV8_9HELO
MPRPSSEVSRRRNGKKQACEPCRKGKLACDHSTPFCGRCVRRKQTARCVYHPAPMTKPKHAPTPQTTTTTIATSQQSTITVTADDTNVPVPSPIPQALSGSGVWRSSQATSKASRDPTSSAAAPAPVSIPAPIQASQTWTNVRFQRSRRYYGPTSFTAVFSEAKDNFAGKLLDIGDADRSHPATWPFDAQPLWGRNRAGAPTVRANETIKVLYNIPPLDICDKLLMTFDSAHNVTMHEVLIQYALKRLWSTFGEQLAEPRTPEKLILIVDALLQNEENPLPPPPSDGYAWLDTFTGSNLRYESLGLLFCLFGIACYSLQDWDPVLKAAWNKDRDRRQTAWRMLECADTCLKMCECTDTINEIFVALLLNIMSLESRCAGDESFKLRKRHGDMVTATIAVGLHRLPDCGLDGVTATNEYCSRLFSYAFNADKYHSSLNGTPPLLNPLYCNYRVPLELNDQEMFLPQPELARCISELQDGWKTTSNFQSITLHRVVALFNSVRDEILSLSLGVDISVSVSKIDELHERLTQIDSCLPERLHYYSHGKTPKNSWGAILYFQAFIRLDLLQNRFLIDRVAIARGLANEQGLLDTALEMMEVTTTFWIKRDQLMKYCSMFDGFITCYGVPSAGVICVELLKQSKQEQLQAQGRSMPTGIKPTTTFSRSDAIQKLTMFLGFLDWVRPTDGNQLLAGRLRKVVRRILDYVLEPPPPSQPQVQDFDMGPASNDMLGVNVDLDQLLRLDEMDCLDWLNGVDWTQGPWMELA